MYPPPRPTYDEIVGKRLVYVVSNTAEEYDGLIQEKYWLNKDPRPRVVREVSL